MRITVKDNNKPIEPQKVVNLTPSQKQLYQIQWEAIVPYGKHQGRTAKWVYENNSKWWQWAEDNEVLYKWDLKVLKDTAMEPVINKPRAFISSKGEQWVSIRIVEETTSPSIWI